MRRQRRTTIIVVGGALAIASVGYGLGTEAGDGTAIADNTATEQDGGAPDRHGPPFGFERGAPPGVSALADRLGVDRANLANALRDYHDQHEADRRDEFAAKLADALGISTAKVNSAFDRLHSRHEDRFPGHDRALPLRQLAKALGVSRADLRRAFSELRAGAENEFKQEQRGLARFLADRFGLDVSKVQDALAAVAPPLRSPDRPGPCDHPPAL
jgi:biotin operon repressor